jgi:hypothetical protein
MTNEMTISLGIKTTNWSYESYSAIRTITRVKNMYVRLAHHAIAH